MSWRQNKTLRTASSQSGHLVGLQQVLELLLEESIKQTALLEKLVPSTPLPPGQYPAARPLRERVR